MKIKLSQLRKVIREEIQRAMALKEAYELGDTGVEKIKKALKPLLGDINLRITPVGSGIPEYRFDYSRIPANFQSEIEGYIRHDIPGADVSREGMMMVVRLPYERDKDPDFDIKYRRDPAGNSVWDK